jgi:NMD protein affecting ribosome stability and mRNA decay
MNKKGLWFGGSGVMAMYCEICGEELEPGEEGICENCKASRYGDSNKEDENYVDPGIT